MKLHSQIVVYILFGLLIASCATSPASIASATTIPSETLQPTQIITETLTQTPTITPTATEARLKVGDQIIENDYTYTYTFIPESGYYGWFRPLANINFYPWAFATIPDGHGGRISANSTNDIGPTTLMVEQGVDGEQAVVALIQNELQKGINPTPLYIRDIETDLRTRAGVSTSNQAIDQFNTDLQIGNETFQDTVFGKSLIWTISPKSGATIYILKPDLTKLTKENGFWEWSDMPWKTHFWTAFWGVNSHGIVGAIAVDKPLNQLDPFELRMLTIWHEAVALDNTDVTNTGFDGLAQDLASQAADIPTMIDIQYQK